VPKAEPQDSKLTYPMHRKKTNQTHDSDMFSKDKQQREEGPGNRGLLPEKKARKGGKELVTQKKKDMC